jgi:hypothetical protein
MKMKACHSRNVPSLTQTWSLPSLQQTNQQKTMYVFCEGLWTYNNCIWIHLNVNVPVRIVQRSCIGSASTFHHAIVVPPRVVPLAWGRNARYYSVSTRWRKFTLMTAHLNHSQQSSRVEPVHDGFNCMYWGNFSLKTQVSSPSQSGQNLGGVIGLAVGAWLGLFVVPL